MKPTATGQIVRFHTSYEGENPDQHYVVLEVYNCSERPRAQIKPLNTRLPFPPVCMVAPGELEVIMVSTTDLIETTQTIINEDGTVLKGEVVSVEQEEIITEFTLGSTGVTTNVNVNIMDTLGVMHRGKLLVK